MKCPKCNGDGWDDEHMIKCLHCHGSGEVDMTNEEWIKSLDTEGLVDYLYEVHKGGNSVERQRWIEKRKERIKMQIRGWLKQPHTVKE